MSWLTIVIVIVVALLVSGVVMCSNAAYMFMCVIAMRACIFAFCSEVVVGAADKKVEQYLLYEVHA